jgi:alpha/beta superfamily hydrolase
MPVSHITIPSGALSLEGALHLPEESGPFAAVAVCHPHPQYGGDMHNNVVMAVVRGLIAQGIAALRFNFRGVGRSGGGYDGGAGEQDDARAALDYLRALPEVDAARVGLAGYSFGAMVAGSIADGRIPALALVALPLMSPTPAAERLRAYPGPLLLMAGDRDHVCPAAALRELTGSLGASAETRLVPGTDHFWGGFEGELSTAAGDFFARHLHAPAGEDG